MAPIRCCFDQTAVWHSDAARGPSTPSFDHLVGTREQAIRHREAERLRHLEIYDQLVLGRRLHRQVGWLLALEDAIDVASCSAAKVEVIRTIGDQAACGQEQAKQQDRK